MNPFFEEFAARLTAAARQRGVEIEPPALDGETSTELLELARVAAHTQERRFAPLAAFMAGVAAERLRAGSVATTESDPGRTAEYIRQARMQLEAAAEPDHRQ